jgi:hypothetical protein
MRRIAVSISAMVVFTAVVSGVAAASAGPPPGLTAYGRVVWNLDALLHDRFGDHQVFEDFTRKSQVPVFSTRFIDMATSVPYAYTFATARDSGYKVVQTSRPPKVSTYPSGENVPVAIGSGYIACGHGEWLYERQGQAAFGGDLWCARTG